MHLYGDTLAVARYFLSPSTWIYFHLLEYLVQHDSWDKQRLKNENTQTLLLHKKNVIA